MRNGIFVALPLAVLALVFVFLCRFVLGSHTFEQAGQEAGIVAVVVFVTYCHAYFRSDRIWRFHYPRQMWSLFAAMVMASVCMVFEHGIVFNSLLFVFIYSLGNALVYRLGYQNRMWGPRR